MQGRVIFGTCVICGAKFVWQVSHSRKSPKVCSSLCRSELRKRMPRPGTSLGEDPDEAEIAKRAATIREINLRMMRAGKSNYVVQESDLYWYKNAT